MKEMTQWSLWVIFPYSMNGPQIITVQRQMRGQVSISQTIEVMKSELSYSTKRQKVNGFKLAVKAWRVDILDKIKTAQL